MRKTYCPNRQINLGTQNNTILFYFVGTTAFENQPTKTGQKQLKLEKPEKFWKMRMLRDGPLSLHKELWNKNYVLTSEAIILKLGSEYQIFWA